MIDWNFSPGRLAILVALIVGFWLLGVFEYPVASESSPFNPRAFSRAWLSSLGLLLGGAVFVSVVDFWVGNVERSNIRSACLLMGVLLMGLGWFWQSNIRATLG